MYPVKFKKLHTDARLLEPAELFDAGHDIAFVEVGQDNNKSGSIDEFGNIVYYTGIAIEMPNIDIKNCVMSGFGLMKSSGSKKSLIQANAVGLIDFGFRGEIVFKFKPILSFGNGDVEFKPQYAYFKKNEYIGQLIFIPTFLTKLIESDELSETDRGKKSYGEATNERYYEKRKIDNL